MNNNTPSRWALLLNSFLLIGVLGLMGVYVRVSNQRTALALDTQQAIETATRMSEQNAALAAQSWEAERMDTLVSFAQTHGMVPSYEPDRVALRTAVAIETAR